MEFSDSLFIIISIIFNGECYIVKILHIPEKRKDFHGL